MDKAMRARKKRGKMLDALSPSEREFFLCLESLVHSRIVQSL